MDNDFDLPATEFNAWTVDFDDPTPRVKSMDALDPSVEPRLIAMESIEAHVCGIDAIHGFMMAPWCAVTNRSD